jgi:hypothetical protein
MGLLRALADSIGLHCAAQRWDGASPAGGGEDAGQDGPGLALPRFLDVEKTVPLTHAEISALYFVVEDFEAEIARADPRDPVDEAGELVRLLREVILRWNRALPEGVYADLFELPWEGPGERPAGCVGDEAPAGAGRTVPAPDGPRGHRAP